MPIRFEKVEHLYNDGSPVSFQALKGIDLDIEDGSMTAIIGHTGSGKSTLIQHINALLLPSSGKVTVQDYVISPTERPAKLKPYVKLPVWSSSSRSISFLKRPLKKILSLAQ